MKVNCVIVHELLKEASKTSANIDISSVPLEINEDAKELVNELNKRYSDLLVTHAVFDNVEKNIFPDEFSKYICSPNDNEFYSFSINTIKDLRRIVNNIAPAKGGYLVYVDYEAHGNFVGIFLIRNKKGKLFEKDTNSAKFRISPTFHIDFEKMAMACRINKDAYAQNETRYLSFVKKGNVDISNYFITWISAADQEDETTDTRYLRQILEEIPTPVDECGNPQNRDVFKERVVNFIKNGNKNIVNLKTLGQTYYNDENYLINYAIDRRIPINTEFKANKRVLQNIIKVSVIADQIAIDFPHKYFNDKIRFDGQNMDLVIIESSLLAEKLRQEFNHGS